VQSAFKDSRKWTEVEELKNEKSGTDVWIRARVHTVRGKGKIYNYNVQIIFYIFVYVISFIHFSLYLLFNIVSGRFTFVVLRRGFNTVQALAEEGVLGLTKEAVKFTAK
jgi:hypothetical protein